MGLFSIFKKKLGQANPVDDEACWTSGQEVELVRDDEACWTSGQEVELVRDDGLVIYKTDRVNCLERKMIGFYGQKKYSNNRKYCIVFIDGSDKSEPGYIALVDTYNNKIIYTHRVNRPKKCVVSNNGIVACNDWNGWDIKTGAIFWVFDEKGNILLRLNYRQNLGDTCEINNAGTIAITDVCKNWEYHIIDIEQRKIIRKVKKDYTISTHLDIEKREIFLKYSDKDEKVVKF